MKKHSQQGSAHAVVVIVLVLALLTALGWIFYQNFIHKEPVKKETDLIVVDKDKNANQGKLVITELDKTLDLVGSQYNDVTYEMTSVNSNDENKYVVAIYSKSLHEQLVEKLKKDNPSVDYTNAYSKLSTNLATYAYYYEAPADSRFPDMIDGVASNIIDPSKKSDASKLYVGAMGPGVSGDEVLDAKNAAFRDWVKENLK